MRCRKIVLSLFLMAMLAWPALGQSPPRPSQTNDPAGSIQQWMNDNLDEGVLQVITNIMDGLNSTNVYDLGELKPLAQQVLPVLDYFEETAPYAAWLRRQLDDMDAADEMQRELKAAPRTEAGAIPRPTPKFERAFWTKRLAVRPLPPLANTYVPKLKEVFAEEKVPPELVWVASVESSFNPNARSPAGAAGMFQLMPATAREEHLSLWPFDQRYQPEKSAHAAARYLRSLHNHYADWPLALAAYNVGENRVDKLLKDHKVRSFDAVSRWLPAETQMYVPKIEATIRRREGLSLGDLKMPRG